MPKLQQTYINDPDKQVRIVLYGRGQPACILPARLELHLHAGGRIAGRRPDRAR